MISGKACKVFGAVLVIAGALVFHFQEARLLGEDKPGPQISSRTFRLNDGTELPIEEWPETYEAVEWQPPIDEKKAKVIVEYEPLGRHIYSIAVNTPYRKVYWSASAGRGSIICANYDGSGQTEVVNNVPTSDGTSPIDIARCLCFSPDGQMLYWCCTSPDRTAPGVAIYRARHDGSEVTPVVTGLENCLFIQINLDETKLYWSDGKRLYRANCDGSNEEDMGPASDRRYANGIDFRTGNIYYISDSFLRRKPLNGNQSDSLLDIQAVLPSPAGFWQFIIDDDYVYYQMEMGIVRSPIGFFKTTEQITRSHAIQISYFAVDGARQQFFWSADNNLKLLTAALPPPWRTGQKTAPPLVISINPTSTTPGKEVTIGGKGLSSTKQVLWIGHPTGEYAEAKFRIIDDGSMAIVSPSLAHCDRATIAIVASGGATVTVPRDSIAVKKVFKAERGTIIQHAPYIVQSGGRLDKIENSVAVVESGGTVAAGLRGNNIYFLKNWSAGAPRKGSACVFSEPHAFLMSHGDQVTSIPVPAIRISYVEDNVTISTE